MITLKIKFDNSKLDRHVQSIIDAIKQEVIKKAPTQIRDAIVREVLNRNNWNPEAVYSHLSSESGRYTLSMSGQLLQTIGNKEYNTISPNNSNTKATIGIGNIPELDKLRSKRDEFGSPSGHLSEKSRNAKYWRFVVFGHRPPKGNYTFVRTGTTRGKDSGIITPGQPKMKGTPPTYMFSNGLAAAEKDINAILAQAINNAIGEVEKRW